MFDTLARGAPSRSAFPSYRAARIVGLFLLAFAVFYLRDAETYRNPVLYTEDGVWLSMIKEHGFRFAFVHARGDYFVALNLLLLQGASLANDFLFNGSLLSYPATLAIVVAAWYSLVAAFPALLFFRLLPTWGWALLTLCLALLPLGFTTYEVLARASNVGFSAFFMASLAVAYRNLEAPSGLRAWLIDAIVVLCVLTNPLVFGLYPLLLWPAWKAWRSGVGGATLLKRDPSLAALLLLSVLVVAAFVYRYQAAPLIGDDLARKTPFQISHGIAYGFGRSFLYPFASFLYPLLNDALAVAVSLLIALPVYRHARRDPEAGPVVLMLFLSWLLATVAVALLRPELLAMFSGYRASNPDRYAIMQNLLGLCIVLFIALRYLSRSQGHGLWSAACVLLLGGYIAQAVAVAWLEHARPPKEAYMGTQLQLVLSAAEGVPKSDFVSVPIYFQGWSMRVRAENLEALSWCCREEIAVDSTPSSTVHARKLGEHWVTSGIDPQLYWRFDTAIPADRIPVLRFRFSCLDAGEPKWSTIGIYWLDSQGHAAGGRAYLYRAKPGWQVVPLGSLKGYRGEIGGVRIDMETIDTCQSFGFEAIKLYGWKEGRPPHVPRLPMPWSEEAPRALMQQLRLL